jgi:DNA-binding GntR family transcriptional regulator
MIDLYVYYKVRDGAADALAPRVRALQQDIAARQGVHGQLKRRPEARDGLQTWMEVYPGVDEAFASLLAQAVENSGLASLLAGPRHAEVFMDLTPCA